MLCCLCLCGITRSQGRYYNPLISQCKFLEIYFIYWSMFLFTSINIEIYLFPLFHSKPLRVVFWLYTQFSVNSNEFLTKKNQIQSLRNCLSTVAVFQALKYFQLSLFHKKPVLPNSVILGQHHHFSKTKVCYVCCLPPLCTPLPTKITTHLASFCPVFISQAAIHKVLTIVFEVVIM